MGYQVALPNNEVGDTVEVSFKNGDYCLEQTNTLRKMYSSIIRLECDPTKSKVKINLCGHLLLYLIICLLIINIGISNIYKKI